MLREAVSLSNDLKRPVYNRFGLLECFLIFTKIQGFAETRQLPDRFGLLPANPGQTRELVYPAAR
jgi:hypothetical protein